MKLEKADSPAIPCVCHNTSAGTELQENKEESEVSQQHSSGVRIVPQA